MGVGFTWAVGELGIRLTISSDLRVGQVGVGFTWAVGELGIRLTISSDLRVGQVGVGFTWAVGELGICLTISHTTTIDDMGMNRLTILGSGAGVRTSECQSRDQCSKPPAAASMLGQFYSLSLHLSDLTLIVSFG